MLDINLWEGEPVKLAFSILIGPAVATLFIVLGLFMMADSLGIAFAP